ncbi:MAG TPA: Ig-like domain-containing protein, partial [Anaerolineales bacterium]|nr:Ig-like domain-containing protein [Anaerolineales bacterium]
MKLRSFRSILCSIFIVALLASCTGIPLPGLETPTPQLPTPTPYQQALPPSLVETVPPLNTVIGHLSPITFYFNEAMDKATVEPAIRGLPEGIFTWNDEATLFFEPTQPYPPNSKLEITIASSIKSSTGFGTQEPIELSFLVADYLKVAHVLPQEDAADVDVRAAVLVSFNQPVVPLGAEASSLPPAFDLEPAVKGNGEWVNTSTYIFYPEPAMAGGTEYTLRLNPDLQTATGVGLEGGAASEWKFTTALPQVVSLEPSTEQQLPLDPQIRLTFNQPMDMKSVESNFLFSGPQGSLNGRFEWSEEDTVLSFEPRQELARNAGYILNVGAAAESKGGETLGEEYGAVFNTFDNFAVTATNIEYYSAIFTFSSPIAEGDTDEFVEVNPPLDNFSTSLTEDGLMLGVYGFFEPETDYVIEISAQLRDRWGQSLGDPFITNFRSAPVPAM